MFQNEEEFKKQQEAAATRKKLVNSCLGSFESAKNSEDYVERMLMMMTVPLSPPTSCSQSSCAAGTVEAQGATEAIAVPHRKKAPKKKQSSPRLVPYSQKHTADEITIKEAQMLGMGFGLAHSYQRRKTSHYATIRNRRIIMEMDFE